VPVTERTGAQLVPVTERTGAQLVPVTERDSHTNGRLQSAAGEYYISNVKCSYTRQWKD